jgi:hypothetical protein
MANACSGAPDATRTTTSYDGNRLAWESEVVDSFWIFEDAKAQYAERRSALALEGFIYSDMD